MLASWTAHHFGEARFTHDGSYVLGGNSEPALLTMYVGSDEIFIRFGEIHNSFDDSDDVHDAGQSKAA